MTVGFGDRLRAWLRGEDEPARGSGPARPLETGATGSPGRSGGRGRSAGRGARRRSRAEHPASAFDASELLEFARSRHGVEVYLEPRTRLYGDSVLLVADDGEYLRRPVPDAVSVRQVCAEHGIPVYDAARTGYPRRVRDYDRGIRPGRVELDDLPPWPGEDGPPPPPPVTD